MILMCLLVDEGEDDWNTAEISELSSKNSELESRLKEQMSSHDRDVEEFETLKADWMSEKEALEEALFELREKLKERETTFNVLEAQKVNKCFATCICINRNLHCIT